MSEIFQLPPSVLFLMGLSGLGIIAVVIIFTRAQTVREREMWTAIQSILSDVKEINNSWLEIFQSQGNKSNDSIQTLSNNIAKHTTQMLHLTEVINKSIENGTTLKGASELMAEILRGGRDGRRSTYEKE